MLALLLCDKIGRVTLEGIGSCTVERSDYHKKQLTKSRDNWQVLQRELNAKDLCQCPAGLDRLAQALKTARFTRAQALQGPSLVE